MAKPQRRTINDALAEIAAQVDPEPGSAPAPRQGSHVATLPRGNATTGNVDQDTMALVGGVDADGYRVRVRREKPHVSLYAHPKVFNTIRDLAVAQRKKPHDLYVEGMRLVLEKYGFDFDKLNRGE
jgi:hypothetical protein